LRTVDRATGVLLLLVSVYLVVSGLELEYTLEDAPGPGFLPFWAGVILGLSAIFLVAGTLVQPKKKMKEDNPLTGRGMAVIISVLGASVMAVLLTRILGLVLSMGLLAAMLVRILGSRSWLTVGGMALAIPVVFYLLFIKWLGVPFPKGFLGF